MRQNYKTYSQCSSHGVGLKDCGAASYHRLVSVILLSYLYLACQDAVITYKYIKVHILTRIKICSFFVWLGFQKSSHIQAIISSVMWDGGEEDLPKSLPCPLLIFISLFLAYYFQLL